ncbi:MAG: hypothetical protein ACRCUF_20730 [Aeromonas sobria]
MEYEVTVQGERFKFQSVNGYLCREVWGGKLHSCCHGGHLQCGSALKIVEGNIKELADKWIGQVMAVRDAATRRKRK